MAKPGNNKPKKPDKGGGGRRAHSDERKAKNRGGNYSGQAFIGKGALGKVPKALKGTSLRKIGRQSRKAIRPAFRPALADLRREKKTVLGVDRKRAADNKYYLSWLDTQSNQLRAHADAAAEEVRASQEEAQRNAEQAMLKIRGQLEGDAAQHAGTVSATDSASAFDLSPEAQLGLDRIVNARNFSEGAIGTEERRGGVEAQSNFAMMAAAEANRQAETASALGDIRSERTKVRLEQAAAEAAEVARRLTQEIEKANSKVDFRNLAASQWMALQAQKLERKKFRFDVKSRNQELQETHRSNRQDERLARDQHRETKRHNLAGERLDAKELRQEAKESKNETGREARQDRRERSKAITRELQNGIAYIKNDPKLRRASPQEQRKKLSKHMDPIFAQAVVQLLNGNLTPAMQRKLKSLGYDIPNRYT